MKKIIPFTFILLCAMAFAISHASAERGTAIILELPDNDNIPMFKLPASVTIIEDNAFEETALVRVELSETVVSIGERAFASISTLREIRIPSSTKAIASTAFEGSCSLTITAPANSYTRSYARNQGIPFSPIVMFCAMTQAPSISAISVSRSTEVVETEWESDIRPETQWRRIEEQNITRTEKLIANHVQGRAPPMA